MKFSQFKEFRTLIGTAGVNEVVTYLSNEMPTFLRELGLGLTRLSFTDNFQSFKVEVTIPAASELAIRNQLRGGLVPSERIIVRGGTGSGSIVDGDTAWGADFVYLKNTSGSAVTVTVLFLR